MLKRLLLENFKVWRHIDSMILAPITGLFGANSSGKSSIIQSLLLLKQTIESSDRSQALNFGDENSYIELGQFRDVVSLHDKNQQLLLGIEWSFDKILEIQDPEDPNNILFKKNSIFFQTSIDSLDGEKIRVKRLEYNFDGNVFFVMRKESGNQYLLSPTKQVRGKFRFTRTPGRVWDLPGPVKFYGFPDQVNTYFQNAAFLSDLQEKLVDQFNNIYYLGPLREYPKRRYIWSGSEPISVGNRGERTIDAILAAKEKGAYIHRGRGKRRLSLDEMLAFWLKELGLIYDFSVKKIAENGNIYQVFVKKTRKSSEVLLTDVGFGVSQVLPVLTLCYYVPEGSTLIFEQPEIHLHPSVQSGLADVFVDAIKHRNIQIIVESHSEHLLLRLQRRIAEQILSHEQVALYFCNVEKNEAVIDPLKTDLFGNIENWPKDFFGNRFDEIAAMQEAALKRKIQNS